MTDVFLTVCTVVGMVTLYTLVAGSFVVWALRLLRRRRARLAGRLAGGAPMGIDRRARSWDELPEWVSQDREWAAAVVVLGSASVAERTAGHINFAERQVDWTSLRRAADEWDLHGRTLVEVADALAHAKSYGPPHDQHPVRPVSGPSGQFLPAP